MYGTTAKDYLFGTILRMGKKIMENPSSWNETQKTISLVLKTKDNESSSEHGERVVPDIVATLKEHNLLKETEYDVEEVILEEIETYYRLLAKGMCGKSLTTRLYHKLIGIGAL